MNAAAISLAGGTNAARYRQIADTLVAGIAQGRYPVGQCLPTEAELCRRFDASRFTVREALSTLRRAGLIASRRGIGSVVLSADARQAWVESFGSIDDIMRHAAGAPVKVAQVADVVADAGLAAMLHCPVGAEFLAVQGFRFRDRRAAGTPLGWVEVHIAAVYGGIRDRLARLDKSFAQLIAERYGVAIARIDQEIAAVALPQAVAGRLRAQPGAPALQITRWYRAADGSVFEIARSLFPAGRYLHKSRIMPSFGA